MGSALAMILIFGFLLIFSPVAAGVFGFPLSGVVQAIMLGFGGLLTLVAGVALIVTKLYVRTMASEAFVKTGLGGIKVIKDGGAVVIPVVHEIVMVSLATLRLKVERKNQNALLTSDKLRADIEAEFYVRVQPEDNDIKAAARSLGNKSSDERAVMALIEDKLVNALRTAAAKATLEELNTERDKFVKDVMEHVTEDLKHNGFTLETVTISTLDQAATSALREDNIFDAQGLRTIAEITQEQKTKRNLIERTAEQERLKQNVSAKQAALDLEKTQKEAEAKQSSDVARIQAEQTRASKEAAISAERAVREAELLKEKSLAVSQQNADKEKELAEKQREQAVAVAQQDSEKAQELASRGREIAIAEQNMKLAEAETKRLEAEKARTAEQQAVETVKAVGIAEMESQKSLIAAKAEAEKTYVKDQKAADGAAYRLKTEAEAAAFKLRAEADAKKASAEAEADATLRKADADASAAKKRAEGDQAAQLVAVNVKKQFIEVERAQAEIPVNVAERQVAVEAKRVEVKDAEVEVLQKELKARAESGQVAQDFELAKLRISAEANVRIETAKAAASFGQKFEVKLVGTPDQLAQLQDAWFKGEAFASMAEGFASQTGPATKVLAAVVGGGLKDAATEVVDAIKGRKDTTPAA